MTPKQRFVLERYLREIRGLLPNLAPHQCRQLVSEQAAKLNSPPVIREQLEQFFKEKDL